MFVLLPYPPPFGLPCLPAPVCSLGNGNGLEKQYVFLTHDLASSLHRELKSMAVTRQLGKCPEARRKHHAAPSLDSWDEPGKKC